MKNGDMMFNELLLGIVGCNYEDFCIGSCCCSEFCSKHTNNKLVYIVHIYDIRDIDADNFFVCVEEVNPEEIIHVLWYDAVESNEHFEIL